MAAEGATYTAPTSIPYQFSMTGSVRGYHNVLSVTSQQDKLQVEKQGDKLSRVNISLFIVMIQFSDRPALTNSANPDQTVPSRSSLFRVYTVCHSISTVGHMEKPPCLNLKVITEKAFESPLDANIIAVLKL